MARGDIESWSLVWIEGGGGIDAANKLAPDIDSASKRSRSRPDLLHEFSLKCHAHNMAPRIAINIGVDTDEAEWRRPVSTFDQGFKLSSALSLPSMAKGTELCMCVIRH